MDGLDVAKHQIQEPSRGFSYTACTALHYFRINFCVCSAHMETAVDARYPASEGDNK